MQSKLFGIPSINVTYAEKVKESLEINGHFCQIEFTHQDVIMKNVKKVITVDEICHRNGEVDDFNTAAAHNHFFVSGRRNTENSSNWNLAKKVKIFRLLPESLLLHPSVLQ